MRSPKVSVGPWQWLTSSVLRTFACLGVCCIHILGSAWDLYWFIHSIIGSSSQRPTFPGLIWYIWLKGTGSVKLLREKKKLEKGGMSITVLNMYVLKNRWQLWFKKWNSGSCWVNLPTNSDYSFWTARENTYEDTVEQTKTSRNWTGVVS